jgi:hypothetical protein
MADVNEQSREEAIRQERDLAFRGRGYGGGLGRLDDDSDGAVAAREEHRERLNYDDNDATAPGEVCELCGSLITAGQQARLRPDGTWIHEACPIR